MSRNSMRVMRQIKRHLPGTIEYDRWREQFSQREEIIEGGVEKMPNYLKFITTNELNHEHIVMRIADRKTRNALRRSQLSMLVYYKLNRNPAHLSGLLREDASRNDANISKLEISDEKLLSFIAKVYRENRALIRGATQTASVAQAA